MTTPVRVGLIDDHALFRMGLAELLERNEAIHVVGIAGNADEARALLIKEKPDVVLMDLHMPPTNGITLLTQFKLEAIDIPTIMLTVSDAQEDLSMALRAGARGYLLKDIKPDELVHAIRRVAEGETAIAPSMTQKLVNLLASGLAPVQPGPLSQLTGREREILAFLARGKSNKVIAQALDISHDTVKLHVRHILSKLKLSSRVEAAVLAVEQQLDQNRTPPAN